MLKSIFSLEDFPSGSYFYWVFPATKEKDYCYGKFKVVGSSKDELLVVDLSSKTNCIETLSRDSVENYIVNKRIIVPEFIYLLLHNQQAPYLDEKQSIQKIFLTGYTEVDEVVKSAKFNLEEYYEIQRNTNEK